MQTILDSWISALQLMLTMIVGWCTVFFVSRAVEQRMRRGSRRGGPGVVATLSRVWQYSNVIGIPTLLVGTAYLVWSMSWGPGLSTGPTALIILLMALAGLLIGFGPGLRR